jgi:hypothetical protein
LQQLNLSKKRTSRSARLLIPVIFRNMRKKKEEQLLVNLKSLTLMKTSFQSIAKSILKDQPQEVYKQEAKPFITKTEILNIQMDTMPTPKSALTTKNQPTEPVN